VEDAQECHWSKKKKMRKVKFCQVSRQIGNPKRFLFQEGGMGKRTSTRLKGGGTGAQHLIRFEPKAEKVGRKKTKTTGKETLKRTRIRHHAQLTESLSASASKMTGL